MLRKIISGNDSRKSRFHTEENKLIPLRRAIVHFPVNCATKILFRKSNRRPRPWWPIQVVPEIEKFITKDHDVIEFGSGSSTLWLASRARSVTAMESNLDWAGITRKRLHDAGISNVDLHFAKDAEYWSPSMNSGPFDLAVIDGDYRWRCFENISDRMRPGGVIYLDDSDSDKDAKSYRDHGPRRRVQMLMEQLSSETKGSKIKKIRSLIDGELFAGEGWLLYLP